MHFSSWRCSRTRRAAHPFWQRYTDEYRGKYACLRSNRKHNKSTLHYRVRRACGRPLERANSKSALLSTRNTANSCVLEVACILACTMFRVRRFELGVASVWHVHGTVVDLRCDRAGWHARNDQRGFCVHASNQFSTWWTLELYRVQ